MHILYPVNIKGKIKGYWFSILLYLYISSYVFSFKGLESKATSSSD